MPTLKSVLTVAVLVFAFRRDAIAQTLQNSFHLHYILKQRQFNPPSHFRLVYDNMPIAIVTDKLSANIDVQNGHILVDVWSFKHSFTGTGITPGLVI